MWFFLGFGEINREIQDVGRPVPIVSETFEQLLAFQGATFCSSSNLEHLCVSGGATFEQIIGLKYKSSTKKWTIWWKTSVSATLLTFIASLGEKIYI